jgi:hypothetical protein
MPDEQPDRADVTAPTPYCTTVPRTRDRLTDACPECGHATVLHLGVGHCPVCELVALNERAREGLVRGQVEISVHGKAVNDQYLTDLLERQALRYGRTKPFPLHP